MSEFDVFLSHNSTDKPAVRTLAKALQARELKVWLDEWELVPGRPWQEALEKIIETTKSAAILVGKDGMGPWERPEMRACLSEFAKRQLPVIPVLLPNAGSQPKLPLFLNEFMWVDLRAGLTTDKIDQLVWAITGVHPDPSREVTEVRDKQGIYRRKLLIQGTVSLLVASVCLASAAVFLTRPNPPIKVNQPLDGDVWSLAQAPVAAREIMNPDDFMQLTNELNALLDAGAGDEGAGYVFFSKPLAESVKNPIVDVAGLNHLPLADLHLSAYAISSKRDLIERISVEWSTNDDPCRASMTGEFPADTRIVLVFYVVAGKWSAVEPPELRVELVEWTRLE